MTKPLNRDGLGAARTAYREQIEFGSPPRTALDLATIVFQQRNPTVPVDEARELIVEALGVV